MRAQSLDPHKLSLNPQRQVHRSGRGDRISLKLVTSLFFCFVTGPSNQTPFDLPVTPFCASALTVTPWLSLLCSVENDVKWRRPGVRRHSSVLRLCFFWALSTRLRTPGGPASRTGSRSNKFRRHLEARIVPPGTLFSYQILLDPGAKIPTKVGGSSLASAHIPGINSKAMKRRVPTASVTGSHWHPESRATRASNI